MFNVRHKEGYISFGIVGKSLHFCKELRPGCYLNATVNLDVHEFGALESMVFIPDCVTLTEPTVSGGCGSGVPIQCPGGGWSSRDRSACALKNRGPMLR